MSFLICVVCKNLERQLKEKKSELSPEKVIGILKTIYSLTIITRYSNSTYTRLLIKNDEQANLLELFKVGFGCPDA